ncbi:MAG TPA: universal stress protein [Candidatus Binataceae bacterium]|jgi:nucleotide-binding universal stress UspA family protein|nr:universal stress protein [Candidatus Binataceae bacterium]
MRLAAVNIRNLMLTTDFSDSSAQAVPYARLMAERFRAVLYVLHVISNPLLRRYGPVANDYSSIVNNARAKARELMATYDAELGGIEHHALIREGDVLHEILGVAREKKIDTIVIASHGEGRLRHLLLGSTARNVLLSASCPVYIIRHVDDHQLAALRRG